MENKSIFQELTEYRVKIERNGKEIANIPGILCLPGLLVAPKMGIAGLIAAPLLGCSIHLENEGGQEADIEKAVRKAAETVMETANTAAKTVREEFEKAWKEISAEEETDTGETEDTSGQEEAAGEDPTEEPRKEEDIPVIHADPDDSDDSAEL